MSLKSSWTGLQLHCITEEPNFPPLDTVRLVILGIANREGDGLVLQKESQYTWKQPEASFPCEM